MTKRVRNISILHGTTRIMSLALRSALLPQIVPALLTFLYSRHFIFADCRNTPHCVAAVSILSETPSLKWTIGPTQTLWMPWLVYHLTYESYPRPTFYSLSLRHHKHSGLRQLAIRIFGCYLIPPSSGARFSSGRMEIGTCRPKKLINSHNIQRCRIQWNEGSNVIPSKPFRRGVSETDISKYSLSI